VITRLYLVPSLGRHRLDRLSVATVQSWLNGRLAGIGRFRACAQPDLQRSLSPLATSTGMPMAPSRCSSA
jgi:hypothetical protein